MNDLERALLNNPQQIVSCDLLYPFVLKVKHLTGIDQITAAEDDGTVSKLVVSVLPDVETWQYGGDSKGFYYFKFGTNKDRETAQQFLEIQGYPTQVINRR